MNTNHQQLPSGIESEVKYTLQVSASFKPSFAFLSCFRY